MNGNAIHQWMARCLVLLLAVAMVSACGWRLRGTLTLPPGLDTVRVAGTNDSDELIRTMEELLAANDVTLAQSTDTAQLTIDLLDYTEDRRVTAVGSNTLVTEYELTSRARYAVLDHSGNEMLAPSETTVTRSYQYDQNDVVSKAEEERIIQREMRRELARQIIYRLRFLNPASAETNESA